MNVTWIVHLLVLVQTPVHLLTAANLHLVPQHLVEFVVHDHNTSANCLVNKVTVVPTATGGGLTLKLVTAKSLFTLDVKETPTTLNPTKSAKITAAMQEVNHNVSRAQLLRIPMVTLSFAVVRHQLLQLVQLIITATMMVPRTDVVQHKRIRAHCHTKVVRHAVQQLLDGTTIQLLEPVRHSRSMAAMVTPTISPHNKTVKTIAVLKVVQMVEKFGKNRMEQLELVLRTDNVHQHITALQSQLGLERYTRRNHYAVHPKITSAVNLVMLAFDAVLLELLVTTLMRTQKRVKHLNITGAKVTETTLPVKNHVKITAYLRLVHLELLLQRNLTLNDLHNARILVDRAECPAVVQMDILVTAVLCLIKMCAAVHQLNFSHYVLQILLHSFLLFLCNQCNAHQMWMELVQETSSAGFQQQQQLLTPSTAVDRQILLTLDIVRHNLYQYLAKVERSIGTAVHQLQLMMQFKDVALIGTANFQQILRDIFAVVSKVMFDCQMFVHHSRQIWFQ